jgi:hypothetical protein
MTRSDAWSADGRGRLNRLAPDTTRSDGRSAEGRRSRHRIASGSGLGAALFGGAMLLLAGAAGAGAATHFTPAAPGLFGMLTMLLGCPDFSGASPIAVFDAADLAMFEDFAEPPP